MTSTLAAAGHRARTISADPMLVAVATARPEHVVDQTNAKAFAAALFAGAFDGDARRLLEVFDHSGVERRATCMPLEWYARPHSFAEANALYVERATALAGDAASRALETAGLAPTDVDHVVFVSTTGLSTPSVDARLANALGFREDVRRTPIWGLGCAGGAAGLAVAGDFARADPHARILLIALELCTLTFQHGDRDRRNLVAASLFADGAAAAVITGSRVTPAPGAGGGSIRLELIGSASVTWRDTLDVMGWTVDGDGLHVVFSRDIPALVRARVREGLDSFLERHGVRLANVAHVIAHPGGPKVLAAYAETLGFPIETFRHAREVLRTCGNMSSPTCLFVLERAIAAGDVHRGDLGVLAALGPGFSAEYVLFRAG